MLIQSSRPDGLERCHNMLRSNALAAVMIIAIVLWGSHVFRRGPVAFSEEQRGSHPTPGAPPLPPAPALNGSHTAHSATSLARAPPHYQTIEGQEVVLERVSSPVAVLLLFHGCQHSAVDWWDRQEACPSCIGLPEEEAIVAAAVRRRYAVVAFSSMDRAGRRCWAVDPSNGPPDIAKTVRSWEMIKAAEGWEGLPVYALGASSGGYFAGSLPFHMELRGICIQIMQLPSQLWQQEAVAALKQRPAVLFVHMARDERTAGSVHRGVAQLQAQGFLVKEISVKPQPLTPAFFSDRIESMPAATSAAIFRAFSDEGMLDEGGMLLEDPRSTVQRWQHLLRERVPAASGLELEPDSSPVSEELNVAWASHEIISATTDETFDFFESQ